MYSISHTGTNNIDEKITYAIFFGSKMKVRLILRLVSDPYAHTYVPQYKPQSIYFGTIVDI